MASNQGCALAQYSLAALLFRCDHVPQNIALAYKFCKLAQRRGEERAREFLPQIKAALELRVCAHCASVESAICTFKKCSRCSVAYYCGAECQRLHWSASHIIECADLAVKAKAEKRSTFLDHSLL
jgi:hypothetical protein